MTSMTQEELLNLSRQDFGEDITNHIHIDIMIFLMLFHSLLFYVLKKVIYFVKSLFYFKKYIYTVKPCYRVHALKLKNSSISTCDSSNLIGLETKKYWEIRVTVHAELRKVLR